MPTSDRVDEMSIVVVDNRRQIGLIAMTLWLTSRPYIGSRGRNYLTILHVANVLPSPSGRPPVRPHPLHSECAATSSFEHTVPNTQKKVSVEINKSQSFSRGADFDQCHEFPSVNLGLDSGTEVTPDTRPHTHLFFLYKHICTSIIVYTVSGKRKRL